MDVIDKRISDKITSKEYIYNLSNKLRPFLVFNDSGVVEYDHGVNKILLDITIENTKEQKCAIKVYFKKFIQNPPLLMIIGDVQYAYKPTRLKNNGWLFSMVGKSSLWDGKSEYGNKYVIEILE